MKQSDPQDQRERSDAHSESLPIVETNADDKKPASRRYASDPDHKKSYRRSWRGASPLTKLQLGLTAVVAIATVIYALFSGWQLYVIRAGGEDTRKLAQAAQTQANISGQQVNAMQGQLETMQDQANSARTQSGSLPPESTRPRQRSRQGRPRPRWRILSGWSPKSTYRS